MSKELFEAVHEAEAMAECTLLDAGREAREMVKNAEAACVENERSMAREHRALYQSILEEKRVAMQDTLDEEAAKEMKKIESQMQKVRERLPQAAKRIAERVMCDGNR
ncbi:MAG: hypothetical protein RR379_02655 [Clostridia bacterium]